MNGIKKTYLEAIRCLALLLVVAIHVVAIPIQNWTTNPGIGYSAYSFVYTIGNFGVPLFLMISGSLLCSPEKEISLRKIYKKMMPRILIPLAFFGYCYALLEIFFTNRFITVPMFGEAIIRVLNRESWGHLWYMYLMIGLYMMLPIIRFLMDKMDEKNIKYTMLILLFMGYLLPTINAVSGLKLTVDQPKPLCHLTVFIMGYLISKYYRESCFRKTVYASGIISLIVLIVFSLLAGYLNYECYTTLARYDNIFVFAVVSMIFMFFLDKQERISKIFGGGIGYLWQNAPLGFI